ncbi:MAG: hypothetical protein VYD54_01755 [Bdellovibrionota bacterium]|nr:hypothetical protein [Bdellovibrionota bacterium]
MHPKLQFILLVILLCSLQIKTIASEIDSFTEREKILKLPNSYKDLNLFVRYRMGLALKSANKRIKKGCSVKRLKWFMVKNLSSHVPVILPTGKSYRPEMSYGWGGTLERSVSIGKDTSGKFTFPTRKTDRKKSIYQDITMKESVPMNFTLGSVVRVEFKKLGKTYNLIIGSDKFGHWIGQGYEYHKKTKENYKHLKKALDHGNYLENSVLGLKASGIYSYGDLAANIMGMVFWDHLIDEDGKTSYIKRTRPNGPYVRCKGTKWVLSKKNLFDFKDYISPAWDETINYSFTYSKVMGDKIKNRIIKLQEKYKKDFTPPIKLDYCIDAVDFFRDKFPYHFIPVTRQVINPICRTAYLKRTKGVWSKKNFLLEGEITDYMDKMTRKNYVPISPNEKWMQKNGL